MDWPGEKLVIRLWDTVVDNGVGSLLKPWRIRREGRAQIDVCREELLMLAQVEHDADRIRRGDLRLLHSGHLEESKPSIQLMSPPERSFPKIPELLESATANAAAAEVKKEINVSRALLHAEAELAEDPSNPSEDRVTSDWMYRWRDSAAAVSDTELQLLWGRALAGEIKSPGSVSYRTLEFLKNITHYEAVAIERLSRLVTSGLVFRDDQALERAGVSFDFLLQMQDLGILSGVESLGISVSFKSVRAESFARLLFSRNKGVLVTSPDVTKELSVPCYKLTTLGEQILDLGTFEPDIEHLRLLGSTLCKQQFQVELVTCSPTKDGMMSVSDNEQLCASAAPESIDQHPPE